MSKIPSRLMWHIVDLNLSQVRFKWNITVQDPHKAYVTHSWPRFKPCKVWVKHNCPRSLECLCDTIDFVFVIFCIFFRKQICFGSEGVAKDKLVFGMLKDDHVSFQILIRYFCSLDFGTKPLINTLLILSSFYFFIIILIVA